MINWNLTNSREKRVNWFFPSFEVQEYLLPIINVGGPVFEEYDDTKFSAEDCFRLQRAIDYHLEGLRITNKTKIRYETMYKGLETIDKQLIIDTLCYLREATQLALSEQNGIVFYGD